MISTTNATNAVLMVRASRFAMNEETAVDNHYQMQDTSLSAVEVQSQALKEFDEMVNTLRAVGVNVYVIQDELEPFTPDSIFPNNWISMHSQGSVITYPMKAENRRLERRGDIVEKLREWGFMVNNYHDFSSYENQGQILEGTGSLIFDHDSLVVYMARSQRADEQLLHKLLVDTKLDYSPVLFSAFMTATVKASKDSDVSATNAPKRDLIYHTNVMMCMTDKYAVICLYAIDSLEERTAVVEAIKSSGKGILEITEGQKHNFAGNMLLVKGVSVLDPDVPQLYLVMSACARSALTTENITFIEDHGHQIVSSPIPTIETLGGGSARCMLAEIYLPRIDK